MPVTHHPFAFRLGPLEVTGFALALILGFAIGHIVSERELRHRGHAREAAVVGDVVLGSVFGFLVGAKLYYAALMGWETIASRGGLAFWGGLVGGVAAGMLVMKARGVSIMRVGDVAAIGIAGGYAVGRTGCWAVGDDYGRPWDGPLAVAFPQGIPPSTAGNMRTLFGVDVPPSVPPGEVLAVYPTQLLETALGLVMFAVLWRLRGHRHAEGWLFGLYMVLAGVERFAVEFLRAKDDRLFAWITVAQLIAVGFVVGGAIWMAARWRTDGARVAGVG